MDFIYFVARLRCLIGYFFEKMSSLRYTTFHLRIDGFDGFTDYNDYILIRKIRKIRKSVDEKSVQKIHIK
jgi:hypothetical protein